MSRPCQRPFPADETADAINFHTCFPSGGLAANFSRKDKERGQALSLLKIFFYLKKSGRPPKNLLIFFCPNQWCPPVGCGELIVSEHLYKNLRKIGIEDPVAYEVSNAMNPARYATRDDMMEAIYATRDDMMEAIQATRDGMMATIQATRDGMMATIQAHRDNTMVEVRAIEKNMAAQREETLALIAATKEQIAANREESREALHKMDMNMIKAVADVRGEMRSIGRQYWITLAALLISIGIAVACNLPGHWKNLSQATHSSYRSVPGSTGRQAQAECPVCWLRQHSRVAHQQVQSAH